jgi:hypothetical protein
MAREYFCAYHSYLASMKNLSDAECGRLFRALLQYGAGDKSINLQGRESIAFDFMAAQIDRDNEAYEAKCQKNKNNILQRYTNEYDGIRSNTKATKEKEKKKENIKERTANAVPKKNIPPSVDEVAAYCAERGNGIDAESFIDHYTARGWMIGKNKMQDWKAAVRTWERNHKDQPKEVNRYADLI